MLGGFPALLGLAGCATTTTVRPSAAGVAAPLALTSVGVEPKTLDVSQEQVATFRYAITQPAAVRIDLVDEAGFVVRQLEAGNQSAGLHTLTWDGTAVNGEPVPPGVYRYILHAHAPDDGRWSTDSTYDPSRDTGGEELPPWDFTYDRDTGTLRWVMPKAGYARLRIGMQGFPHLRTLMDWAPLEAGEREVIWDGLDASGLISAKDHPNLAINLSAFAMPHNTVIVRHGSPAVADRQAMDQVYPALARPDAAYLHARHPRAACHEARLRIDMPKTWQAGSDVPVVSGVVPVRVVLDERDAEHLTNSRFEIALFEDTTFLAEEEEGTNPFTYLWDTTRLAPGEHLLTANILSYDDHYGVETIRVMVEPPQ